MQNNEENQHIEPSYRGFISCHKKVNSDPMTKP